MKAWREANPGYWRRGPVSSATKLKDPISLSSLLAQLALQDSCPALQDSWNVRLPALLGLIAWVRGSALQDTIAADLRDIMFAGHAILDELRTPPAK